MAPSRVQDRLGSRLVLFHLRVEVASARGRLWCSLGVPTVHLGLHQTGDTPHLGDPRRSWDRLGLVRWSSCGSGSLLWTSWAPVGAVWGDLGRLLGDCLRGCGALVTPWMLACRAINRLSRCFRSGPADCTKKIKDFVMCHVFRLC